jgi:transcriptional regulator with XRE-family HTH domain
MTPRPLRLVLGDNLRRLMERDGLSKSETAARLGMHRTQLYRMLNGETRPHASELKAICDLFGVPASVYFKPLKISPNFKSERERLKKAMRAAYGIGKPTFEPERKDHGF